MNKILKWLIFSDIFLISGFGFTNPIFAIFIVQNIAGGDIFTAGIASSVFLVSHSLLQMWFAYRFKPDDRRWMLLLGTFLIMLAPFGFIFATNIWQVYGIQLIHGIGAAFAYPTWQSFFTSNLEKGKRGFQWSLYSSGVCLGASVTAILGGLVAEQFGFQYAFMMNAFFAVIGFIFLTFLDKKEVLKKV